MAPGAGLMKNGRGLGSRAWGERHAPFSRPQARGPRPEGAQRRAERGFALLYVFTLGVLLAIMVLMAWPDPLTQRKREREAELIYRGEHIARAIREFQQENSRYPTSLKEMMEVGPKNHRYLRQLYTEPVNPSGDWDLIPLGDPSTLAQLPNGQANPAQTGAQNPATAAEDSFDRFSDSLLSKDGDPDGGTGSSPLRSGDQRQPQRPPRIGRCRGAAGGAAQPGAAGIPGLPGAAPAGQPIGRVIGTQIGVQIGTPLGSAGPGTQIVGVASLVDEDAFREYQKKKKYCEWLFLANQPPTGTPGQPLVPVGGINPPTPSR